MSLDKDRGPVRSSRASSLPKCSLPELFECVENLTKESKKSNLRKTQGLSVKEAQKMLTQSLNAMAALGGAEGKQEEAVAASAGMAAKVAKRGDERPMSMTELLHRSLVSDSLSPVERLFRSRQRLSHDGIPAPMHNFPYDILASHSKAWTLITAEDQVPKATMPQRTTLPSAPPEKIYEDRLPRLFLVYPEKQFVDLKDLELKYFKGLVKWSRTTAVSFPEIRYDTEKRFVQSREMPAIFPPLIRKTLFVYPQIDYQTESKYPLKWDI
ncbi:uncharacterized protein C9orf153 homolog [Lepus europaeus]|uniref:uncharacterized protein C9orf153 homolog n=1 Tax=Lepus europaeus TaxID=9983 RepID=UPI002B4893F1|nr:uncharacterized protein C9orf153 homolog [Lepus europaeus]